MIASGASLRARISQELDPPIASATRNSDRREFVAGEHWQSVAKHAAAPVVEGQHRTVPDWVRKNRARN